MDRPAGKRSDVVWSLLLGICCHLGALRLVLFPLPAIGVPLPAPGLRPFRAPSPPPSSAAQSPRPLWLPPLWAHLPEPAADGGEAGRSSGGTGRRSSCFCAAGCPAPRHPLRPIPRGPHLLQVLRPTPAQPCLKLQTPDLALAPLSPGLRVSGPRPSLRKSLSHYPCRVPPAAGCLLLPSGF